MHAPICLPQNGGMVNQDGKHQWHLMMQSMSKPKKEEKLMIAYVRCMMFGDVLNMFLLHINDHNQDKEHVDAFDGMDKPLV